MPTPELALKLGVNPQLLLLPASADLEIPTSTSPSFHKPQQHQLLLQLAFSHHWCLTHKGKFAESGALEL